MKQSPVQIVLNSSDFIEVWDRQGGGEHKDFYADHDSEFVSHKTKISEQLLSLKPTKKVSEDFSDISYAKVILKQSALAKTHRPTISLFDRQSAPIVGGGDLGEIYIELQPTAIDKINSKIQQAEPKTKWKIKKDGKKVPNPSAVRSELGAIEDIKPYLSSDKRKFSINEGIKWLLDPRTGGAYVVELFEAPPPPQHWDSLPSQKYKLFKSFEDGLMRFGSGLVATRIIGGERSIPILGIRLEQNSGSPIVQFMPSRSAVKRQSKHNSIDFSKFRHSNLIKFLDEHPLVRKITLPPIISKSNTRTQKPLSETIYSLPKVIDKRTYPKVGIVDGGVSKYFGKWVEEKHGLLSDIDKDESHGTFIAGLLLSGNSLNGSEICQEFDGCKIIDLDILPIEKSFANYYLGPDQFFDELENAVKILKTKTGVRIFNFSLNIEEHASTDTYSLAAKKLDEIAEDNDVIFVISAGNTAPKDLRKEWPNDTTEILKILATSTNDKLKKPAESYRNLSVAALNPPNLVGVVPFALSNYSCRGPGTRIGLKPDLAHIGGSGTKCKIRGHGLYSIDTKGNVIDGCGTSYAAPNVAKILASLEHSIEGTVSRETLIALAIHNASVPGIFADKNLRDVAKDLVGFGIPEGSESILAGNDHSITLLFANRITPGKRMSFSFSWPTSLVRHGKCYGKARLSIVSTPPFDYKHGSEFVRINIEGHLRQLQTNGSYKGRLSPVYLPEMNDGGLYEKNRIEHSFKWSPVKVFEKDFPKGVGPGSDWKLEVEYLARAGERLPDTGVPFSVLLTISDPKGEVPVFDSMRQSLQSVGVKIVDIKTAARIVSRV